MTRSIAAAAMPPPTFAAEAALWQQGRRWVAGVDEVGRGPLAGPLLAAAVILPPAAVFPWLGQVRDSKQLSPPQRQTLAACIGRDALASGLGLCSPHEVDDLGLTLANRTAMLRALDALARPVDYVLVDALTLPQWSQPQRAIVHGDTLCLSIACASIVAKVARDRLMTIADGDYPGYGFSRHKGYATPEHLAALARRGPSPIHRRSFAPVRRALAGMK